MAGYTDRDCDRTGEACPLENYVMYLPLMRCQEITRGSFSSARRAAIRIPGSVPWIWFLWRTGRDTR